MTRESDPPLDSEWSGASEAGQPTRASAVAPQQSPGRPAVPPVVLVIDDDAAVRGVVGRQLVRLGWAVRAFPSAEAALAWLGDADEAERPALVVSDVDMPGLTGLELATILRRDYPALGVLLLSGRGAPGLTPVRATDGAPLWLLGKPYDVAALARAVERTVLAHWGAPRAAGAVS